MRKIILLAVIAIFLLIAPAFAASVAKVNAFPNGEGLEEFLGGIDSSKISRAKRSGDYDDTAVVVVPLLKDCYIYFLWSYAERKFRGCSGSQ